MLIAAFVALLSGCTTTTQSVHYPEPFKDPVDIAVNLGLKYSRNIDKLERALVSEGIPCRRRAMSLNAEQIVVERGDFDRAKVLANLIIIRERLTVRIYTSPDSAKTIGSKLEVWEKGKMVREEQYKLY
jgi:hypothetical protein